LDDRGLSPDSRYPQGRVGGTFRLALTGSRSRSSALVHHTSRSSAPIWWLGHVRSTIT
jgi:hypothetical protein